MTHMQADSQSTEDDGRFSPYDWERPPTKELTPQLMQRSPFYVLLLVVLIGVPGCSLFGSDDDEERGELVIEDLVVGDGTEAEVGMQVSVHYVGTLENGYTFDSSRERDEPLTFILGSPNLLSGFNAGVQGMKVGGVRRVTIPPHLGYGNRPIGSIPANSTLIFEIELLDAQAVAAD
jgi:hypothetical protein